MVQGCQTCLRVIKDPSEGLCITSVSSDSPEVSLKEKLIDCIPELILEDTENVVLCHLCATNLTSAYKFKQRCLETQQKIYGFLQQVPINSQIDVGKIAVYYQRMAIGAKVEDTAIADSKPQKMPYNCTQCQFACLDKCVLMYHEILHKDTKPPYKCNECSFIFPTTPLLLDHLAIHTNERPYACNLCDFVTAVHKDLKEHSANHRKTFQCTICWKRFPSRKELTTHVEGHKNEDDMRPFRCGWCNFKCDTVNMLRIHRNDMHQQGFKCKLCKVPCRTELGLMQHMKWIHSQHMQMREKVHVYDTVNCEFSDNLIGVPDNEDTPKSTFAGSKGAEEFTSRFKLNQPDTFIPTINRDVESLFQDMHSTGTMVNACQSISEISQFESFDTTNIAPDPGRSGPHPCNPPTGAHELDRNWQSEGINRIDVYIGNSNSRSHPCNVLSNSDQIDRHHHSEGIDRIDSYASNCGSPPSNYLLNSGKIDINRPSGSINKIDGYIINRESRSSNQQFISSEIKHKNPQSDIAYKSSSESRPSKHRADSSIVRNRIRESEGINRTDIASNTHKNSSRPHSSKSRELTDKSRQPKSMKRTDTHRSNNGSRDFNSDNGRSRKLRSNSSSGAGIASDTYKSSSGTRSSNLDEVRSRNRRSKVSNIADIASDTHKGSSGFCPSNTDEVRDINDVVLPNTAENLNERIQLSTGELQNNLNSSQAASLNQNVNITLNSELQIFPTRDSIAPGWNNPNVGETRQFSFLQKYLEVNMNNVQTTRMDQHSITVKDQHVNITTSTAAPGTTMTPIYVQQITKKKKKKVQAAVVPCPVPSTAVLRPVPSTAVPRPVPSTAVPTICLPAPETDARTPAASLEATPQVLSSKKRRRRGRDTRQRIKIFTEGGGFIRIPRKSLPSTHPLIVQLEARRLSKIMDINDFSLITDKNAKLDNEKGEHSNSDALQSTSTDVISQINITLQPVGDITVDGSHSLGSTAEKSDSINVDVNKSEGTDEVHQHVDLTVLDV